MDLSKFSLDYIRPSGIEKSDPWSDAVRFYGGSVLGILQEEGRKTVDELYGIMKVKVNAPNLEFEQFAEIVQRMASDGRISVARQGNTFHDYVLTLPVQQVRP